MIMESQIIFSLQNLKEEENRHPLKVACVALLTFKRSIFSPEGSVIIGPVEFGLVSHLVV